MNLRLKHILTFILLWASSASFGQDTLYYCGKPLELIDSAKNIYGAKYNEGIYQIWINNHPNQLNLASFSKIKTFTYDRDSSLESSLNASTEGWDYPNNTIIFSKGRIFFFSIFDPTDSTEIQYEFSNGSKLSSRVESKLYPAERGWNNYPIRVTHYRRGFPYLIKQYHNLGGGPINEICYRKDGSPKWIKWYSIENLAPLRIEYYNRNGELKRTEYY